MGLAGHECKWLDIHEVKKWNTKSLLTMRDVWDILKQTNKNTQGLKVMFMFVHKCYHHSVFAPAIAADWTPGTRKRGEEREREGEEHLFFVFVLCQPQANVMLVNRNILVRQEHSWVVFTFPAALPEVCSSAGLRDAHIRSGAYLLRLQLAVLMRCRLHSKNW